MDARLRSFCAYQVDSFDKVFAASWLFGQMKLFLALSPPKIDAHRSKTAAGNFSPIAADNSLSILSTKRGGTSKVFFHKEITFLPHYVLYCIFIS